MLSDFSSFSTSYQGCTYYWLSQISRTIPIWCGSQLAWKSFRIVFSELPQDEDVYSIWCGAYELRNHIKLFQCSFLWQLTRYKVCHSSNSLQLLICCPLSKMFQLTLHVAFRYQFVPQMIFLNSLFGYLSLLIVVKWCTGSQADLYHVMIYMFLSPFDNPGENQLFWGQRALQVWFWFFYSLLLNKLLFYSLVFISLNYCSIYAGCVIAFGCNCSSMDALSKTFYTKEASWWGATFASGLWFYCLKVLYYPANLLVTCKYVAITCICLLVWVSLLWLDFWSAQGCWTQFFLRSIIRSLFCGLKYASFNYNFYWLWRLFLYS